MRWFLGILVLLVSFFGYGWWSILEEGEYASNLTYVERFYTRCIKYATILLPLFDTSRSKSCEEVVKKLVEKKMLPKNDSGDFFLLVKRTEFIYEDKVIIFNIEYKSGRKFHLDPREKYPYQKRSRGDFYTIYPEGFYIPK